jgi:hypothetical protein
MSVVLDAKLSQGTAAGLEWLPVIAGHFGT